MGRIPDSVGPEGIRVWLLHGAVGIGALPASVLFGGLWAAFGPSAAFTFGAIMTAVATLILVRVPAQEPAAVPS